jgi:hypothetical protein
MHCLYCDRPLALIKRLTGDGEFCSKECRKNYQREHNQLALARLLETQPPKTAGNAGPTKSKAGGAAPLPPPQVAKPQDPGPGLAGFFTEYPPEALAVSDALQSTGSPRFADAPSASYRESQSELDSRDKRDKKVRGAQPKTALLQSEPLDARSFGGGLRSSNSLGFKLYPALPMPGVGALARCQPGGAGLVSQQPAARNYSGVPHHAIAPQFRMQAIVEPAATTAFAIVCERELRCAKFISVSTLAEPLPGAIRRLNVEPRWKALQSVLPERIAGKVVYVLGTFLRRPVRTAGHDGLPEMFEIPLRPISFPPFSPRMACLEERMHRTDRIGFSPP